MLKQSWSLGSTVPALCPKCSAEALHRSHAHSHFEEKRKQLGSKRPYRCHECGWRGWLQEAQLRYSAAVVKARVVSNHSQDVEIPDISLGDSESRTLTRNVSHRKDEADRSPGQPSSQETEAAVDYEGKESGDFERPLRVEDAGGDEELRDEQNEIDKLPEFDEASGKPVTHKVDTAFHHHARHRSKACPGCGEGALYRSRARNFSENVKKKLTMKRLFRCHRCGWRGWLSKGF